MNVLSLFDGISCGRIALKRAGIKVDKYYSSEIDKYAIQIANKNYQLDENNRLGDITKWKEWDIDWNNIDLLIGGSPCQGFSIAGRGLNFNDSRSKLFFTYLDILNYLKSINPNIKFILENVKMKDGLADIIDSLLDTKRVFINSQSFTGHIRKRYYWSNISISKVINDGSIKLSDVIDNNITFDRDINFFLNRTVYSPTISSDGIITINPKDNKGKQTWQRGRVYDIKGSCPTICASLFDLNITKDHKKYRKLTINECEKLQGLNKDYTFGIPFTQRGKVLGNGWTVDVIAHILKQINN